jgi:TP901 family phage tail tape measure protein
MPTSVGTVYVDVRFNTGDVARQLQAALASATGGAGGAAGVGAAIERSFAQTLSTIGTKAQQVGRQMSVGLTLPLVMMGRSAVSSFQDFDKAMTQISAINKVNAQTTDAWREEVRALGREYGIAAEEAAQGLYFITSSGVEAADAMSVLDVAMKGAAVGFGDTKTVADLLTSALSAYRKTGLTAAKVGDQLAASVRLGKGEADDLAGSLSQVIPIAANLKVSFGEVSGALAAMTLSGTSTDQAATQLRGLFNTLQDMPPIAQRALQAYTGLDYATLRQNLSNKGLVVTLKQIYDAFGDNKTAMAEVFGNIRALTGVFNLFGNNSEQTLRIIEEVTHASGDLNSAWEITAQSKSKQLEIAMNNVHDAMIGLGADIVPAITPIVSAVGSLAQAFGALPGPVKQSAVAFGLVAAAAGPVTYAFGGMARMVSGLATAFTAIAPSVANTARRMSDHVRLVNMASKESGVLSGRIGGLSGAIGTAGVAVAGAAAAWAIWNARMDEANQRADALYQTLARGRESGGVKGIQDQISAAEQQIRGLQRDISKSSAPWDADYRAELEKWIAKLREGNDVLAKRETLANQAAAAGVGKADAIADWLAAQFRNTGKIYTNVEEVRRALTEAFAKGDEGAKAVANSTGDLNNELSTTVSRAKETSDAFQSLIDSEEQVADARAGVAEAQQKVVDAQEKYHEAQRDTLRAEQAIVDAQRKAVEATNAVTSARQRLTEAQNELNEAIAGPSEDEKLDVEGAKLALQQARRRLSQGDFDNPLDRKQAKLDVRRARLELERAEKAHDARVTDLQGKVADAQDAVNSAVQAEIDANQAVIEARESKAAASRDEAKAYGEIGQAQLGVRDAEKELADATIAYEQQQDALNIAIATGKINGDAYLSFLENLKTKYPEMAGVLDQYITKFTDLWKSSQGELKVPETPAPPPPPPAPTGPGVGDLAPQQMPNGDLFIPGFGFWKQSAAGNQLSAGQGSTVNERGMPELWEARGKQYLLPTTNGRVTPLKPIDIDVKGGDSGTSIGEVNVYVSDDPVANAYEVRRQLRQQTRTGART